MTDRERFVWLLEAAGLQNKTVAEAVGCSEPYVSQVRTGVKPVPAEMLEAAERLARKRVAQQLHDAGDFIKNVRGDDNG